MSETNLTVIARTLNEERNIDRFCTAYAWADRILIADGGSTDRTTVLAKKYPNVQVKDFNQRVFVAEPGEIISQKFMNPESAHENFLITWAVDSGATWVIADDVDCAPNKLLQKRARAVFEDCPGSELLAYRLYCWMDNQYFPDLNKTGQSLWAWKPPMTDVRCNETDPKNIQYEYKARDGNIFALVEPYVLLHRGWPTPEVVKEKMERYVSWGRKQTDPLTSCGPLAVLPQWAED